MWKQGDSGNDYLAKYNIALQLFQDIVAWVTMGMHHIPHAEDIPNVATAAQELVFALLPFNFFDEDPSMASRDAVRVDAVLEDEKLTLKIDRNQMSESVHCIPQTYDYRSLSESANSLFVGLESTVSS